MRNHAKTLLMLGTLLLLSACGTKPALHIIGVYEGSYPPGVTHSFGQHPDGSIDVHVRDQQHPVVLGLCSYEPINWHIRASDGVTIQEIILSGNHQSKVVGVPESVKITRQAFGYSYEANAKSSSFATKLKDYTGLEVQTFQGMYAGKEFSIQ